MAPTLKGILYMCAGVLCLALGDAITKWLGASYSPLQIIFFRTLVSLPLIVLIARFSGGVRKVSTKRPGVHLLRGLIFTGTMICFMWGLTLLPLAEATAIIFAAPLFVTLLSVPLLKERVDAPTMLATLLGFAGVIIVVRPGADSFQPATLIVVAAAVFYALTLITARRYGSREHLWAMVFYTTLIPLLASAATLPWVWKTPALAAWPLFVLAGILGVGAMAGITMAFRYAPAALAAPFDYTGLVWAVLLGWWIWDEVPDVWVLVGGSVVIFSGLLIAWREGRVAISRRPAT
ncbi:MAG TPA: DMT family transporter [Halomonas sp.]|nr:DMT family transporter [Halomonas sp.]